jgi:biopolymer transport protein ExbB
MTERVFAVAHYADQAVLILLMLLTVMAIYLIVDRYFVLQAVASQNKQSQKAMQSALLNQKYEMVETMAKQNSNLPENVCYVALNHYKQYGEKGLDEVFRSLVMIEKPKLERSLGFLATVGSNAPYIGLFGTVLGIMKSFHDLAQSTGAGQTSVMSGISAALIATAAGLMVAIPCVLAFNYFQKQVKSIMSGLDSAQELFMLYIKTLGGPNGR